MILLRLVDRALQFLIARIIRAVILQLEIALRLETLDGRSPRRHEGWAKVWQGGMADHEP